MFTGPISIAPVLDRLRDQVPTLRQIGGAADLDSAQREQKPNTPAAFVLVPAERAGAVNASTQRFRQQVTAAVSVVSVVLDYRHAERGAAEEGPLTALIAAERAALLNWPHPQANRSTMQLSSTGRLLRYKDALLWWQDIYQVEYQIQL